LVPPTATPPASTGWQPAVIVRIVRQSARIRSVFLRSDLPPHLAGQHIDVKLTAPDGYAAQRSYSIASASGAALLELAIERLDDGEVSPYFHDVAQPEDVIEIRGPIGGHFVWRESDGGPLLLVAGGSGIAPLLAIARQRAQTAADTEALLIYSARTWDDLVYREELESMTADTHFRLALTTTREEKRRASDYDRRLDRGLLASLLTQWPHRPRRVYVCGANAFVETVTAALVAAGIPAPYIRAERYGGDAR
jgi:ferredoxin-NADP reductase